MPYTPDTAYTLGSILKDYDPQGKLHHVIDVFSDKRPITEEGHWEMANDTTSHEMMRLVSKPSGAFTRINEGYEKEAVVTVPVKEQLAMIGSRFELDKRLADLQANPGKWRADRAKLHIRGMMETFNSKFYLGNATTDPKEVNGLAVRYNSKALTNVKSLGGSANLYPVWILQWGVDGVQLLYPKGGAKTFDEDDRGLVDLVDVNGNPYPGYRSYFNFRYGIGVGDDRCVQRIGDVDVTAIKSGATFEEALIERINELPSQDRAVIYVGRQVMTAIQQRLNAKTNLYFTTENVWGRMMPTFQGLPIVRDDSLSVSESALPA